MGLKVVRILEHADRSLQNGGERVAIDWTNTRLSDRRGDLVRHLTSPVPDRRGPSGDAEGRWP
jgi:hypothetical protein